MAASRSVLLAAFVGLVAGQYEGWEPGQVAGTMCYWDSPRVAVIRDTLWIDGGTLAWVPTMQDGSYGDLSSLNNPRGLMYSFNFSKSFDGTTNLTNLIGTKAKSLGGSGSTNSIAPNMIDGALLYNDAEFFLYGGALRKKTDVAESPDGDRALVWRWYDYPEKPLFEAGGDQMTLSNGITRYVAYGGAASAPSENKAWYVGGMRSPVWGDVFRGETNRTLTANTTSNYLITLDMSQQYAEKFSNETLPSFIKPRANPSVVWVPVGPQGILVVVGGVTYPEVANFAIRKTDDSVLNKEESPTFMKTIDIYDVASKKWYQQETKDGPPALTKGCAVVAPAQDRSSFNVYYYGGYSGIDAKTGFSDDVWVLSLPSFQWTRVYQGESLHARAGHQCVMPYPDQMMVIGGFAETSGGGKPPCVDKAILRMFNVSSAQWSDSYSPSKWSNYTVPTAVQSKIGGNGRGSATATTPVVSGWSNPSLAAIFATPYVTSKINTWYPYTEDKATPRPTVPGDSDNQGGGGGGGGTPKWVAPVLGVVLGLVFITAILVGFCLWRRRKILRRGNGTATTTDDNGSRIISWIRGQPSEPAKAPTVTTEEMPSTQDMSEIRTPPPPPAASPVPFVAHEMADNHIAELPDTSPRAELHGVGLTPVEIINKHTHFGTGSNPGTVHQSSYYASVSSNENASSISRSSGALGYQTRAQSPDPGPPSPPITTSAPAGRVGSDVSGLSEHDARHLRNLSQATVSSTSSGGEQDASGAQPSAQQGARGIPATVPETPTPGHPSPLSPPTGASDGEDYISARMLPVSPAGTGTLRRSMFHESEDDLGSRK
ncbi:kelch repeat protein [Colletotrichum truncatum]|uniref:Kelch repeat protein n=1 Tax=Colletotrichum truncatum TaxID=5467 RepID=A0ACC3YN62_COLTU|nr:kelch repeat protein [Colletotrichum truncatum]KAF6789566.1 kelch repeat protein [Colletotrichum truncatum]